MADGLEVRGPRHRDCVARHEPTRLLKQRQPARAERPKVVVESRVIFGDICRRLFEREREIAELTGEVDSGGPFDGLQFATAHANGEKP